MPSPEQSHPVEQPSAAAWPGSIRRPIAFRLLALIAFSWLVVGIAAVGFQALLKSNSNWAATLSKKAIDLLEFSSGVSSLVGVVGLPFAVLCGLWLIFTGRGSGMVAKSGVCAIVAVVIAFLLHSITALGAFGSIQQLSTLWWKLAVSLAIGFGGAIAFGLVLLKRVRKIEAGIA